MYVLNCLKFFVSEHYDLLSRVSAASSPIVNVPLCFGVGGGEDTIIGLFKAFASTLSLFTDDRDRENSSHLRILSIYIFFWR